MLVHIAKVLDSATLDAVKRTIDRLVFQDGGMTAGWHARTVKHNQQAAPSPELGELQHVLVEALEAHPVFTALTLPHRIAPPLLSRTGPGETYGTHVDDALIGAPARRIRTDLSVTIFLDAPESYEGGELAVDGPAGEESAKVPAGDAIVYPSTTLHRVMPVTAGERRVAVTWVQSLVRDAATREMLFDLDRARRGIFEKDGKSEAFDLVSKSYANLLRRHAEI
ncbi:MAG: Fe2+-dependent dioxygenase [Hyphomicrobiaceae bacterium]